MALLKKDLFKNLKKITNKQQLYDVFFLLCRTFLLKIFLKIVASEII
jgi:hypothetical protein